MTTSGITNINAKLIHQHPDNPRKDLGDLTELSESIKKKGIMQNLTVIPGYWDEKRTHHEEGYTLIIGHRRFAAGKMAGVTMYPCRIVEDMSYKDQVGTMLEENMQRIDLTPLEQAEGFQMMLDLGDTEEQIAEKTGFAIVLIGHLNKSSGTQSTYRGLGSIDIMAAVRSLIFIGKVRKDPTTRVLIHEKSSLAPPGETMAFKLGDEEGFRWVGAYEISTDELLDGKEGKATETKLERGAKLIRELLADKKEISIRELDEKAKEQGISGRTMRDVRSRMKNELEYQVNEKQENSIRLKE